MAGKKGRKKSRGGLDRLYGRSHQGRKIKRGRRR